MRKREHLSQSPNEKICWSALFSGLNRDGNRRVLFDKFSKLFAKYAFLMFLADLGFEHARCFFPSTLTHYPKTFSQSSSKCCSMTVVRLVAINIGVFFVNAVGSLKKETVLIYCNIDMPKYLFIYSFIHFLIQMLLCL